MKWNTQCYLQFTLNYFGTRQASIIKLGNILDLEEIYGLWNYFIHIKISTEKIPSVLKDVQQPNVSDIVCGGGWLGQLFWTIAWQYLLKSNRHISYDKEISFLSIYPTEKTFVLPFIKPGVNSIQMPISREAYKKIVVYTFIKCYYTTRKRNYPQHTVWMNLINRMLSETS